jgi:hypothetical protein
MQAEVALMLRDKTTIADFCTKGGKVKSIVDAAINMNLMADKLRLGALDAFEFISAK